MELENFALRVIVAAYNDEIPMEYAFKGADMLKHELEAKGHEKLSGDAERAIIDLNNDIIEDFDNVLSPGYDYLLEECAPLLEAYNGKEYRSLYERHKESVAEGDDPSLINRKLYMKGFFDEDSFVSNIPLTNVARRAARRSSSIANVVKIPNLSKLLRSIDDKNDTGNRPVKSGTNDASPTASGGNSTNKTHSTATMHNTPGIKNIDPRIAAVAIANGLSRPLTKANGGESLLNANDWRNGHVNKIERGNGPAALSGNTDTGRADCDRKYGMSNRPNCVEIDEENPKDGMDNSAESNNSLNNNVLDNDNSEIPENPQAITNNNEETTPPASSRRIGLKRNWNKYIMNDRKSQPRPDDDCNFKTGMEYLKKRCEEGKVTTGSIDMDIVNAISPNLNSSSRSSRRENSKSNTPQRYSKLITGDVSEEMISLVLEMKLDKCNNIVTEDDIIGLDSIKKLIKDKIVQPILRPHLHVGLFKAPKGILLFGPPGTGKTTIAKWVAHVSKATFFEISPSSITSKFHGETESIIKTLFKVAEFDSPSLIFIDEVDAILGKRRSTEDDSTIRMKNQLLQMMDGLNNREDSVVVVAAATNRPDMLDDAALRRFAKRVLVPLPDLETRKKFIFDILNKNTSSKCQLSEEELNCIANATHGWSGCDLMALCSKAAEYSYDDTVEQYGGIENIPDVNVFRSIMIEDFNKAIKFVNPSSTWETFELFQEWDKKYGSH